MGEASRGGVASSLTAHRPHRCAALRAAVPHDSEDRDQRAGPEAREQARPAVPHRPRLDQWLLRQRRSHRDAEVCRPVCTRACLCAHACTYTCACLHVSPYVHVCVCVPVCVHACTCACLCVCVPMHASMHASIYLCVPVRAGTSSCSRRTACASATAPVSTCC